MIWLLIFLGLPALLIALGIIVDRLFGEAITKRWQARRRRIDSEVLWPALKRQAPDLDLARTAFAMHALRDPAWRTLGEDEIIRRIEALK